MKFILLTFIFICSLSGCGQLRISPKSCKTNAFWDDEEKNEKREHYEKESFFVFLDTEILLRDLFKEHGIECQGVKKVRLKIGTTFFFFRKISFDIVR